MDRLSDYDYDLPEHLIAQTPLEPRDASRLLVLRRASGEVQHRQFSEVASLLEPGDCLILNNTRVTARRLFGTKATGGQVEILLLKEVSEGLFEAMVKPSKRLKPGIEVWVADNLICRVGEAVNEVVRLVQVLPAPHWREALEVRGQVPLPPYITESLADPDRYQTVFAQTPGSAAAPTAGLHFTPSILESLQNKGVTIGFVTLDVSLDTFRPVTAENLDEHVMHGETCRIAPETAAMINCCTGRVFAVGTTSVRTLESFAIGPRQIEPGAMSSRLFIRPGYEFRVVEGMFTNFHMPRTTMLMMLAAFASRPSIMAAYQEAIHENYRFLSFGDSMLIF